MMYIVPLGINVYYIYTHFVCGAFRRHFITRMGHFGDKKWHFGDKHYSGLSFVYDAFREVIGISRHIVCTL